LFILRALQQFGGMSVRRHIFSALFHLARRVNGTFKVNTLMTKFQYRTQISLFKERNSIRAAAANIYNIKMQTVNSTFFILISSLHSSVCALCVCVMSMTLILDSVARKLKTALLSLGGGGARDLFQIKALVSCIGVAPGAAAASAVVTLAAPSNHDPSIYSRSHSTFFFVHSQISIISNCMQ
jgi:hypothetical protein